MCEYNQQFHNPFPSSATPFVTAVIVAVGNSTRMGGVNKQFLLIDGVPVLIRTLLAFSRLYTAKVYFQTGDLFAWTAVVVAVSVIFERLFLRLVDAAVRKAGG